MHRHTKLSPKKDTELKIISIAPVRGRVLDSCCGLGYTAILAASRADEVFTFEKDENVLRMAKYNPYSEELFSSKKIKLKKGSIAEQIHGFPDSFFDRIIHDPPTFKHSPELYSEKFYRELFRVLRKGGRIYHYCPSPGKTKGKSFFPRIIRGLKSAGFDKVRYAQQSSGVLAGKS